MRFMAGRTGVLVALGYVVWGVGACVPVETPAADDVADADVSAPRDEAARDGGGGGGSFNAGANPEVLPADVSAEGRVEITAL